jgi:hypothetical protein
MGTVKGVGIKAFNLGIKMNTIIMIVIIIILIYFIERKK